MPLRIALVVPRRRFIANRYGLGYQVPLGLVFIGGTLLDAGHTVVMFDNDVLGLRENVLARRVAKNDPHMVMIGHTGSMAAHSASVRSAQAIRARLPNALIVYGGVFPSSCAEIILLENDTIDIVVCGEGEETSVELARVVERSYRENESFRFRMESTEVKQVKGITWRRQSGEVVRNGRRSPIRDLDSVRPGWELVDWSAYKLFGFPRAAGMQFSRGCPLRCSFCAQWSFWRAWRHRTPKNFVDQLEILRYRYGVRFVWLADESFAVDREVAREVMEEICARKLDLLLNLNMTAADVVRDADLMPLYRRAGVINVVIGVETLDPELVRRIGKNNPVSISEQAVKALRKSGIVALANLMYGFPGESWRSLGRTFTALCRLDADVLNAVYLTPLPGTREGTRVDASSVIQPDLDKFTFRNQIVHVARLSPGSLFAAVKVTELLFHLRPRALLRLCFGADSVFRQVLRAYYWTGARVLVAEILEFMFSTRFARPGKVKALPGASRRVPEQISGEGTRPRFPPKPLPPTALRDRHPAPATLPRTPLPRSART